MSRIAIILLLISPMCLAGNVFYPESIHASTHLREVNPEWDYFSEWSEGLTVEIQFASENDRIRFHLHQVCDMLDARSVTMPESKANRRQKLTTQLRAYADAMVFPRNREYSVRRPCFIDDFGNACAVGYLMLHNGFAEEAYYLAEKMNYAYVKQIPPAILEEWSAVSGLSIEEMALIQPGYPPEQSWINAGQGVEGDINAMIPQSNYLVVAGDFNFDGVDANVARYNGSVLSAFPSNIDGVVYELVQHEGKMWACGSFQAGFADHARWNAGNWEYQLALPSKYSEAYTMYVMNNVLYLSCSTSGFAGLDYYVVRRNADNDYTIVGEFDAPVRALGEFNGQLVAGGEFVNLVVNGNEVACGHVAVMTDDNNWQQVGEGLPSAVRTLLLHNDNLYAGGDFYNPGDSDGFAFARWNSGNEWIFDAALDWFLDEPVARINKIFFWEEEDKLLCGGDFTSAGIFDIGGDMGELLIGDQNQILAVDPWTYPMVGDIRDIEVWGGDLYICGGFSFDNNALSDLAKLDYTESIPSAEVPLLQTWPNPAIDMVHFDATALKWGDELRIFDAMGRLVHTLPLLTTPIDLGAFEPGHYRLQVWNQGELRLQSGVVLSR